jgi:uncharacterized protein YciI
MTSEYEKWCYVTDSTFRKAFQLNDRAGFKFSDSEGPLLAGSLKPNQGGGVVAHNTSLSYLESRVNGDPFVAQNVVSAEVLEITASKADERLKFLLE